MKPCNCGNFKKDAPYTQDQCRLYWLYHNCHEYHDYWARHAAPVYRPFADARQAGCCG